MNHNTDRDRTYLDIESGNDQQLPARFHNQDSRFPDALVHYFLEKYTRPGDTVFDPFAGFGTTLLVAESLGRRAFGVEMDEARHQYVSKLLSHPGNLIQGDSRKLADLDIPQIDFSITSPPYDLNVRGDVYAAWRQDSAQYEVFLDEMRQVYSQLALLMKPGARAVIKVSNVKTPQGVRTVAWDLAGKVKGVLPFEGEQVICRPRQRNGYNHSYALIFTKPE
jgi:DNA modification methylase